MKTISSCLNGLFSLFLCIPHFCFASAFLYVINSVYCFLLLAPVFVLANLFSTLLSKINSAFVINIYVLKNHRGKSMLHLAEKVRLKMKRMFFPADIRHYCKTYPVSPVSG